MTHDHATQETRGAVTTRVRGMVEVPEPEALGFLRSIFADGPDALNILVAVSALAWESSAAHRVGFVVLMPRVLTVRYGFVRLETEEDRRWFCATVRASMSAQDLEMEAIE